MGRMGMGRAFNHLAENLGGWPAVIVFLLGSAAALLAPYAIAAGVIEKFRPRWYARLSALVVGGALGVLINIVTWYAVSAVSSTGWNPTQAGMVVLAGVTALAVLRGTAYAST